MEKATDSSNPHRERLRVRLGTSLLLSHPESAIVRTPHKDALIVAEYRTCILSMQRAIQNSTKQVAAVRNVLHPELEQPLILLLLSVERELRTVTLTLPPGTQGIQPSLLLHLDETLGKNGGVWECLCSLATLFSSLREGMHIARRRVSKPADKLWLAATDRVLAGKCFAALEHAILNRSVHQQVTARAMLYAQKTRALFFASIGVEIVHDLASTHSSADTFPSPARAA